MGGITSHTPPNLTQRLPPLQLPLHLVPVPPDAPASPPPGSTEQLPPTLPSSRCVPPLEVGTGVSEPLCPGVPLSGLWHPPPQAHAVAFSKPAVSPSLWYPAFWARGVLPSVPFLASVVSPSLSLWHRPFQTLPPTVSLSLSLWCPLLWVPATPPLSPSACDVPGSKPLLPPGVPVPNCIVSPLCPSPCPPPPVVSPGRPPLPAPPPRGPAPHHGAQRWVTAG